MTVENLIELLKQYPLNSEVMILDSFNGGGYPRSLNFGPTPRVITSEDADESSDCEGMEGQVVALIGYGSY